MTHAIKSKHRWHRTIVGQLSSNLCAQIERGMCLKWNLFVYHEWSWIQNCFVPIEGQIRPFLHLYSFDDERHRMMTSSWLVKVQFGHINNEIPRISNIGFDGNHHLYHAFFPNFLINSHQIGSNIITWHDWTYQIAPKNILCHVITSHS